MKTIFTAKEREAFLAYEGICIRTVDTLHLFAFWKTKRALYIVRAPRTKLILKGIK
jgi:hypothetical protein